MTERVGSENVSSVFGVLGARMLSVFVERVDVTCMCVMTVWAEYFPVYTGSESAVC